MGIANWAAILTALVAVWAFGYFLWSQRKRRKALEGYLREQKLMRLDEARRTIMHLMANLSMTEAEVLQAGFQSSVITAAPGIDEQGRTVRIYFEYTGADVAPPQKL